VSQDLSAPAPVALRERLPEKRAKPAPARRDPYFDNAKYLTIVLVACGHAWEPLTHGSRPRRRRI
jgi:hypothetical protein